MTTCVSSPHLSVVVLTGHALVLCRATTIIGVLIVDAGFSFCRPASDRLTSVVPELLDFNLRALSRLAVTKEGSMACLDAKVIPLLLEVLRLEKQATKLLLASDVDSDPNSTQVGGTASEVGTKLQQQPKERGAKDKRSGNSMKGSVDKGTPSPSESTTAGSRNSSSSPGATKKSRGHVEQKVLTAEQSAAPLRAYLQHIHASVIAPETMAAAAAGSSNSSSHGSNNSSNGGGSSSIDVLEELWHQPGAVDGFEGQLALWCLLNMSCFRATQVPICRHGLYTLLGVVKGSPDVTRRKVAAAVLEHVSGHRDNTTMMYKAELRMKQRCIMEQAGLARVLKEPPADATAATATVTVSEMIIAGGDSANGTGDLADVQNQPAEEAAPAMTNLAPRRGFVRMLDGGSSSFMVPAVAQGAAAGTGGVAPGPLLGVPGAGSRGSMVSVAAGGEWSAGRPRSSQMPGSQRSLLSVGPVPAAGQGSSLPLSAAAAGEEGMSGAAAGVPRLNLGPKLREEAAEGAVDVAILGSSRAAGVRAANSGRRVSADTQQAAYFINKATPRLHKVGGEASRTSCFLPSTGEDMQLAGDGHGGGSARLSAAVLETLSGSPLASARLSNAFGSTSALSMQGLQQLQSSPPGAVGRSSISGAALGPSAAAAAAGAASQVVGFSVPGPGAGGVAGSSSSWPVGGAGSNTTGSKSAAGGAGGEKHGGGGGDARVNFLRWLAEFEGSSWDGTFASTAGGMVSSTGAMAVNTSMDGGVRGTKAGALTFAGTLAATLAGGATGEDLLNFPCD